VWLEMVVLVLHLQYLEQLQHTLAAVVVELLVVLLVQAALVVAVMENQAPQEATMVLREPQTLVEAVAVGITLAVQAVQALSFFATPAQFNISLVAQ
jgi:hypothetical protein